MTRVLSAGCRSLDLRPAGVQVRRDRAEKLLRHRHLQRITGSSRTMLSRIALCTASAPAAWNAVSLENCSSISPPTIVGPHVHHRVAQFARLQRAADALLGRGDERRRQHVGLHVASAPGSTPRPCAARTRTVTLANRPDAPACRTHSPSTRIAFLQRLAVADARLADAHLQAEVALHAVLLDLQVQHAHAVHQRLAGVRVQLRR